MATPITKQTNGLNVFELGVLVILETKVWNASKKVPPNLIIEGVETKWVNATKKLIDSSRLKEIKLIRGQARHYLDVISLPFPLNGMMFVPKGSVGKVEKKLVEFANSFNDQVDRFCENYETYVDEARKELGDLFNETDYPMDIRSRFSIQWRYMEMKVPDKLNRISPEVYQEEMKKFQKLMQEAQQEAIMALRQGFAEVITNLCNAISGKLDGKPKTLQKNSIKKIEKFFESFEEKNVFKDTELKNLIRQARQITAGIDVNDLKRSDALSQYINKELKTVKNEITKLAKPKKRLITV